MSNKTKPDARARAVRTESRICFGIAWFATEQDAQAYAEQVAREGRTYNGGYFHGMACGRDPSFDITSRDGHTLYAVTD